MITIYQIINKNNGKCYIGLTKDINKRFQEHITGKGSRILYSIVQEYGLEILDLVILEQVATYTIAAEREKFYIEKYDSYRTGYNKTLGGEIPIISKEVKIERSKKAKLAKKVRKQKKREAKTARFKLKQENKKREASIIYW